ncbi:MAG: class I SAM-dependent methyltransferase [Ferrovibrio sp.]|uniref:class I SAM-dependent methyltransferase n=1 Tax=Ferrovibrio sp. TaxID=1917215 RepID=UPI00260CC67F|nr:methyltransferase domain-containing protein [Ferrovibrio sp.]MCW0233192.1 class I SAM-dependent methyltransferase [Ferrovibrio sp.]
MKTVLHVGCGPRDASPLHATFRQPDWRELRLDIDPEVKPDIVGSMTDMHAVPAASVDAIWSSHNIEHVEAHEVAQALNEFRRVLKPAGFALIATPDLQEVCRHVAEGRLEDTLYTVAAGPIAAIDILYGWRRDLARGRSYMAHRTGFTRDTLKARLKDAGFAPVAVQANQKALELTAIAFNGAPDEATLRAVLKTL